ncbi:MAG: type II secretion system protein [Eubacterium sp.]
MQFINKLKKNQKGFTLVELIVVLVILAILAAFTIPAMLGFVDDAKGKAYIAEAREVYMAYQGAMMDTMSETPVASYVQPTVAGGATATGINASAYNKLTGDLIAYNETDKKYSLTPTNAGSISTIL